MLAGYLRNANNAHTHVIWNTMELTSYTYLSLILLSLQSGILSSMSCDRLHTASGTSPSGLSLRSRTCSFSNCDNLYNRDIVMSQEHERGEYTD